MDGLETVWPCCFPLKWSSQTVFKKSRSSGSELRCCQPRGERLAHQSLNLPPPGVLCSEQLGTPFGQPPVLASGLTTATKLPKKRKWQSENASPHAFLVLRTRRFLVYPHISPKGGSRRIGLLTKRCSNPPTAKNIRTRKGLGSHPDGYFVPFKGMQHMILLCAKYGKHMEPATLGAPRVLDNMCPSQGEPRKCPTGDINKYS